MRTKRFYRPQFVLATVAPLALAFWGCNSTQPRIPTQAATQTFENGQANYTVIKTGSLISGKFYTDDRRVPLGVISFGSDNEILWKENKLSFVDKNHGVYRFFDHVSKNHLRINSKVDQNDKNITVLVESNGRIGKLVFLGNTQNGTGNSFIERFNRISIPENYICLIADSKRVDGNAIELDSFEYGGSLRLTEQGCLLNERPATITPITSRTGAKSLVIANGEHNLAISPNGVWIIQNAKDAGISLGGTEQTLESFYLTLRQNIKEVVTREPEAALPSPARNGTGFFISTDGFLISNAHVVEGAAQIRLVTSAGLISAKVVKVDAANDLALLKAEGRFAALPVAASRGVKLGGTVVTVGFPNIGLQGFAPKLAKGEIASLSGAGDDARYFQISVPVQSGNSGGALVDERGNVVGVVSAKLNAGAALAASGALPENVNYAVKSSYLLSFLESVPDVASKLKEPSGKEKKFEDVVKDAEQAAVLVLVY